MTHRFDHRVIVTLVIALFVLLLVVQWAIDHAVSRWLIDTSQLPDLR